MTKLDRQILLDIENLHERIRQVMNNSSSIVSGDIHKFIILVKVDIELIKQQIILSKIKGEQK